jgi:ATP-binding cassette subfamily B protein
VAPDIKDKPGAEPLVIHDADASGAELEFRDVDFHYAAQAADRGLRNVSFKVKPGTTTAVVGHTGAGKTTIGRLLFRFYDVQGGGIFVDGQCVADVQQKSLRRSVGVVPQDAVMFNESILFNVRYGRVGGASVLVTFIRVLCTLRKQSSRSICNSVSTA